MGVTGEAKGTAVTASPVKVQNVIKSLGAVGAADMVKGGFHLNLDIFHFFGIVVYFGVGRRKGGGKKRVFHWKPRIQSGKVEVHYFFTKPTELNRVDRHFSLKIRRLRA